MTLVIKFRLLLDFYPLVISNLSCVKCLQLVVDVGSMIWVWDMFRKKRSQDFGW